MGVFMRTGIMQYLVGTFLCRQLLNFHHVRVLDIIFDVLQLDVIRKSAFHVRT
jgi:hypothetical protein